MKTGNHKVHTEIKKYPEFKKDEIINVKIINRKNGLYKAEGKGNYTARVLKGILSPVTE